MGTCGSKQIQKPAQHTVHRSKFSTTEFPSANFQSDTRQNDSRFSRITQQPREMINTFSLTIELCIRDLHDIHTLTEETIRTICSQVVMIAHNGTTEHRSTLLTDGLDLLLNAFDTARSMAVKESAIRAISQLARCSRADPHKVTASDSQKLLALSVRIMDKSRLREWAYVTMHACDLLRYLIATPSDRQVVVEHNIVQLLSEVVTISVCLDAENDLVKSAFQALLAIGPAGQNGVFEVVSQALVTYFFHSSVVTPALASLMSISSDPVGAELVLRSEIISLVKRVIELHKYPVNMRAYGKRIMSNAAVLATSQRGINIINDDIVNITQVAVDINDNESQHSVATEHPGSPRDFDDHLDVVDVDDDGDDIEREVVHRSETE